MKEKRNLIFRYFKLIFGLFLCALGTAVILRSELGLAPWDVLHQGLGMLFHTTIGKASIVLGIMIVVFDIILGQPIGLGTVINFLLVGYFMDLILKSPYLPIVETMTLKIIFFTFGLFIYSYGIFLYMYQEMGCGPRDGLMQILTQKSRFSISVIKNSIEIFALVIGYFLGGNFGVGTVIVALGTGPILQKIFEFHKVEIRELQHRDIKDEFITLKNLFKK